MLVADTSRSSGLAGLIHLGEQVTLGGPGGGPVATAATQDEGDAHREHGAGDRPGLRCAPEILPMNKMTPMTISPGATTAASVQLGS